jgi:hypothetical protein
MQASARHQTATAQALQMPDRDVTRVRRHHCKSGKSVKKSRSIHQSDVTGGSLAKIAVAV